MKARRACRVLMLYAVVLPVLLVLLFPICVMVVTSLKDTQEVYAYPPRWVPGVARLANYADLWRYAPLLGRNAVNSVIIATGATVVVVLVSFPAAYALARFRFRGRRVVLLGLLGTEMFSPIVMITGAYLLLSRVRMLNTYQSLILFNAALSTALCVWLLTGYIRSIPREIEEAAMMDGCTLFSVISRVVVPLSLPAIGAVTTTAFIQAWNEFLIALTVVSEPTMQPLTVGLFRFIGYWRIQWNYLCGASLLTTIPVVVLFLFVQKWFVQGLTAGGVNQ